MIEDDAISREELLKAIETWDKFGVDDTNSLFRLDNLSLPHYVPYIHYDDVIKCIKGMPSVTQSGKWNEYYTSQKGNNVFNCKECGHTFVVTQGKDNMNYCPNCGAKMVEQQESEE